MTPLSSLDAYPCVRELLVVLLDLTPEDAGVPFELLVRMHCDALRIPLRTIAAVTLARVEATANDSDEEYVIMLDMAYTVQALLNARYPALADGAVFQTWEVEYWKYRLNDTFGETVRTDRYRIAEDARWLRPLAHQVSIGWFAYQPLVTLYHLAEVPEKLMSMVELLEAELVTHPQVGQMIRDLMREGRTS